MCFCDSVFIIASYLPVFLQPRLSLKFQAAMLPSCLKWGSCCGRWRNTHPPCMILPDHTSQADQKWHPQLFQLYLLAQDPVWKIYRHVSVRLNSDCHYITRKIVLMLVQIRALPHKIHPKKSFITIGTFSAPHCFISNAHLMLVCTHLCPPKPCWFTQHDCMSVAHLLNLNVCTLFRTRKGAMCYRLKSDLKDLVN